MNYFTKYVLVSVIFHGQRLLRIQDIPTRVLGVWGERDILLDSRLAFDGLVLGAYYAFVF
jgi:hypothetical protein